MEVALSYLQHNMYQIFCKILCLFNIFRKEFKKGQLFQANPEKKFNKIKLDSINIMWIKHHGDGKHHTCHTCVMFHTKLFT